MVLVLVSVATWGDTEAREATNWDFVLIRILVAVFFFMLLLVMVVFLLWFWWVSWGCWLVHWFGWVRRFGRLMHWLWWVSWLGWLVVWFWWIRRRRVTWWSWLVDWLSWRMVSNGGEGIELSLKSCKVRIWVRDWFWFDRFWLQGLHSNQQCSCEELASHYKKVVIIRASFLL